jgi:hypothetical protein
VAISLENSKRCGIKKYKHTTSSEKPSNLPHNILIGDPTTNHQPTKPPT